MDSSYLLYETLECEDQNRIITYLYIEPVEHFKTIKFNEILDVSLLN